MPPKLNYAEGEKLLCFHGPLIYEAKCLKISISDDGVKYFIHYAGWNKNWDEWVSESRMLKYNEANLQKKKDLQLAHALKSAKNKKAQAKNRRAKKNAESAPSQPGASDSKAINENTATPGSSDAKETKREATGAVPKSTQRKKKRAPVKTSTEPAKPVWIPTNPEYEIKIPNELRLWLLDDWHAVEKLRKLVLLPANLTVSQILNNYFLSKKIEDIKKSSELLSIVKGLEKYFDVLLGSQLLYKFERPQYAKILKDYPDTPMSQIYGAMHLLRMFVKAREMLPTSGLTDKGIKVTKTYMQSVIEYLMANRATLFSLQEYVSTTREYHRRVQ